MLVWGWMCMWSLLLVFVTHMPDKLGSDSGDECHTPQSHLRPLWKTQGPAKGTENASTHLAITQNRTDWKTTEINFWLSFKVVLPLRHKTGCSTKKHNVCSTALPKKGAPHLGGSAASENLGAGREGPFCSLVFLPAKD